MKSMIFSAALILGFLASLSAQDIYLPVSSTSEKAKSEYFKALQVAENANIPAFFDGMKAAVKTDPNFFMAYVNLAFAETAFGQYEKAAAFIKTALAIDPAGFNKGEQIHRKALQALDKDPKADPAEFMEALTAAYPKTAEAHDVAGRSAVWLSKDPKASLKHFLRLVELRPRHGGGYNSLGYTYMALGEMGKAKAAFEKYIALAPKEANAYDSMAEYYLNNKEYAKSVEYYDKAAAMGNGSSMAGAERARAAMKGNVAVIDGLYQSFAKGDVPDVLSRMDAKIVWNEAEGYPLADGNPYIGPDAVLNGVFARVTSGHEYFKLKDIQLHDMSNNQVLSTLRYDGKVKHNGEVYSVQAAHLWTLNDAGKIIAFQQYADTKKAAEVVEAGSLPMIMTHNYYLPVSTKSQIAKAAYYKAALLGSQVRIGEAKTFLDEAIKKDPDFFMAYALKIYYSSDKEKDALIDKALAIDSKGFNDAEKNLRQQLVIWDKDPKASVAKNLKSLVAAYPNTPQAYYWAAANAGFNDKDDDAAIGYALQLAALSPDFGAAYNILGYSYMRKKEMEKAKSAFENYLAASPSDANPYDSMADYFMANKEYKKAAEYYDKAVEKGMSGASERAAKARETLSPTATGK